MHANVFTITSITSEEELEYDSTGNIMGIRHPHPNPCNTTLPSTYNITSESYNNYHLAYVLHIIVGRLYK